MAGYTDRAFRQLIYENGLDHAVTEMVSAKALCFNDRKTLELLKKFPGEKNTGVQIFASDVESISKASYLLNDFDFSYIDKKLLLRLQLLLLHLLNDFLLFRFQTFLNLLNLFFIIIIILIK